MICKNNKGKISVCKTSRICVVVEEKIFLLKKNDSFFLQFFCFLMKKYRTNLFGSKK